MFAYLLCMYSMLSFNVDYTVVGAMYFIGLQLQSYNCDISYMCLICHVY